MFLIFGSTGAINLNFWMEFLECNILHFPTHRYPWVRLVYHLHATLYRIACAITTANFDEIENEHQTLSSVARCIEPNGSLYSDPYQILSSNMFRGCSGKFIITILSILNTKII